MENTNVLVTPDVATPKKRPGRPPKKRPNDVVVQSHGVVETPEDPENILEMVYENPGLFKKLFALFKKHELSEITFEFFSDRVTLKLQDEKKHCILAVEIHGRMLVRYYCAEPITRTVKRDNLDKIFKSIDKNYIQVTFILQKSDSRSKMHIILTNNDVDAQMNYGADLIVEAQNGNIEIPNTEEYPVQFELPSKHFKKLIGDIHGSNSRFFCIRKDSAESPLCIAYDKVQNLSLATSYKNPEKIKLRCDLDPYDIFTATVPIAHVKPFTDSNIGDTITVRADKYKDISMHTSIDNKKYTSHDGKIIQGYVCDIYLFAVIERTN